jgi:hypothetical protein
MRQIHIPDVAKHLPGMHDQMTHAHDIIMADRDEDLNNIIVYHGTTTAAWEKIKKRGIVPGKTKNGDKLTDPTAVYFTSDPKIARQWAILRSTLDKSPIIIKFKIPMKERVGIDMYLTDSYKAHRTIEPKDILAFAELGHKKNYKKYSHQASFSYDMKFTPVEVKSVGDMIAYAVVDAEDYIDDTPTQKSAIDDFFDTTDFIGGPIVWTEEDTNDGDPEGDDIEKSGTQQGAFLAWQKRRQEQMNEWKIRSAQHRQTAIQRVEAKVNQQADRREKLRAIARQRQQRLVAQNKQRASMAKAAALTQAWQRKKQDLAMRLEQAVQARDPMLIDRIKRAMQMTDNLYAAAKAPALMNKHLPGKHDQLSHGRPGKDINRKYITDDVKARLPKHLQEHLAIVAGFGKLRGSEFTRAAYNPISGHINYNPENFAGIVQAHDLDDRRLVSQEYVDQSKKNWGGADFSTDTVLADPGALLLRQTIQHEVGHYVFANLEEGIQAKADKILTVHPIKSPVVARYQGWKHGDLTARILADIPSFPEDRVRQEMFAEAVRWKQMKSPFYNQKVPVALRLIIDNAWKGIGLK